MHKVLIVEDEPLAREIMENYVQNTPNLELEASVGSALEAFSFLANQKIDLVLLDINLPDMSGMRLIQNLKQVPAIIFTTAYPNYALESYELNAIDYLLKPISIERFNVAIQKYMSKDAQVSSNEIPAKGMFVRSEGKWVNIEIPNIQMVEALKDYIRVYVGSERIIIHSTLKNFGDQLKPYQEFIRIHKSYLINLKFTKQIESNTLEVLGQKLMIGSTYKEELMLRLKQFRL